MPTAAIRAFGISLRIGNGVPLAALTITNATNATPIVITTSAAHGITDVSYGTVAAVGGNAGANGPWIVSAVNTTQLTLRGSSGTGAYTSGGTFTPSQTFTQIAEVTNIEDAGLVANLLDVTAHDAVGAYASRIPTFLSGNAMRVTINLVPAHATHNPTTGLMFLLQQRAKRQFLLVLPDTAKTSMLWTGWVASDRAQAPATGALTAQATIEIDGAPVLTAA